MKTPDRIYISPSIRTEIAYYSRILIGNPKFNICPRYGNEIEYIRTDIHKAEINALKAELAELKAPPKVLSAEEVTEAGFYLVRADNINPWVPCIVVRINEEIDELRMLLLGRSEEFSVVGELRPFQMPEVCDAG